MVTSIYLITFLAFVLHPISSLFTPNSKVYRNIKFKAGPCRPNQTEFPFLYDKKRIKIIGGVDKISINFQYDVLEDLHGPFTIATQIIRCRLDDRNNCETYNEFTLDDICALTGNMQVIGNIVLGPLMSIEPKIDCIDKVQWKGTYSLRNYTLDLQGAKLLPIGGYIWKMQDMRSFRGFEKVLCINIDAVVRNVISSGK